LWIINTISVPDVSLSQMAQVLVGRKGQDAVTRVALHKLTPIPRFRYNDDSLDARSCAGGGERRWSEFG
jgi:hypothetical protein